jgi:transposase
LNPCRARRLWADAGHERGRSIGRKDRHAPKLLKLAKVDTTLPDAAKAAVAALAAILEGIEKAIDDLEGQIADAHARSEMNRLLAGVPGVGKLIASVITVSTPDPSVFRSGRDFAA